MRWRRSRSWWPLPPGTQLRSATFGGSPPRRPTSTSTRSARLAPSPTFPSTALTSASTATASTSRLTGGWRPRRKTGGTSCGHGVPRKGFTFDGQQLAAHAFRVARIRWTWDLQRPRFRATAVSGPAPELADHQSGARQSEVLSPSDDVWDIDLVVSYDQPYWPNSLGSLRDNARLGPLRNEAGLWLTATSYHRSQKKYPTPEELSPRLPRPDEEPNRIMCGGPGPDGGPGPSSDMYWFVETITSRQLIEASVARQEEAGLGVKPSS